MPGAVLGVNDWAVLSGVGTGAVQERMTGAVLGVNDWCSSGVNGWGSSRSE